MRPKCTAVLCFGYFCDCHKAAPGAAVSEHPSKNDGDMVTFVDDATTYFGHKVTTEVNRVTNKNFAAIEQYMHANKLKIHSDKTLLLVISKSRGSEVQSREARVKRAEVELIAGDEVIQQSDSELLLGATVHQSGTWAPRIRDGKAALTV